MFYGTLSSAFVALVLPFDSFEGLQGQTLRPFFAGWGLSQRLVDRGVIRFEKTRKADQEGQSNFNIEVV
jgi:hypothetical protein